MSGWQLYLGWLGITSLFTFLMYGYDKFQARSGGWRVPESALHIMTLVGGFPGGWLGRSLFRHKIRKGFFLFVLLLGTVLHAGLAYSLFIR